MLSGINIERQDTLRPKVIFNINIFFNKYMDTLRW